MRENTIDNLFEIALEQNELSDFILGKKQYFVLDRECDEHWPLGSYKKYIEPSLNKTFGVFSEMFWEKLVKDFEKSDDKNILLDSLIAYFTPYYYGDNTTKTEERKNMTPPKIISMVKQFIENNKESLRNDKRGTGAEWNSSNGLLGSLIENLKIINERGGPNFIPDDLNK